MKYLTGLLITCAFLACNHSSNIKDKSNKIRQTKKQSNLNKYTLKNDTVEGLFSSASNDALLFIKPESWESDEAVSGTLYIRDKQSRTNRKLLDSIDAFNCPSFTTGDQNYIFCTNSKIYRYNSTTQKRDVIFQTTKDNYIEAMAGDSGKLAMLSRDLTKSKVSLKLIDISSLKQIFITDISFETFDKDAGSFLMLEAENKFVFNIGSKLILFDCVTQKITNITKELAYNTHYQFAFDGRDIIYFEYEGNDGNSVIKDYSLLNTASQSANFNLNKGLLKVDNVNLSIASYFNNKVIYLENGKNIYSMKKKAWERRLSQVLFKNSSFEISNRKSENNQLLILSH